MTSKELDALATGQLGPVLVPPPARGERCHRCHRSAPPVRCALCAPKGGAA